MWILRTHFILRISHFYPPGKPERVQAWYHHEHCRVFLSLSLLLVISAIKNLSQDPVNSKNVGVANETVNEHAFQLSKCLKLQKWCMKIQRKNLLSCYYYMFHIFSVHERCTKAPTSKTSIVSVVLCITLSMPASIKPTCHTIIKQICSTRHTCLTTDLPMVPPSLCLLSHFLANNWLWQIVLRSLFRAPAECYLAYYIVLPDIHKSKENYNTGGEFHLSVYYSHWRLIKSYG